MRRYDPGDKAALRHTVEDEDGAPTDATVTFQVTVPGDDAPTTIAPTHTATGVYDVLVPADEYGVYPYTWFVTGAVTDNDPGKFYVADDDSGELPPLASLDRFGKKLG